MWFGRELFHRPQAPQCRHQQRPEISVPMPLSAVITAHLWCRSPSQVWLLVEGSSPRGNDLYFDMYFTLFQFQINKNAANLFWTITAKRTGNSALIQFENIFIVNPIPRQIHPLPPYRLTHSPRCQTARLMASMLTSSRSGTWA